MYKYPNLMVRSLCQQVPPTDLMFHSFDCLYYCKKPAKKKRSALCKYLIPLRLLFLTMSEFSEIPSFTYINPDDLNPKCSVSMIFQVKLSPTKCTGNAVNHNVLNANHLISEDRKMKNVQTI
jgi:hypothetical protein